ncbi:MAG: hypothetical protein AKCLJLPJ_02015 [Fimbriimonadales bacterium]|nr:hypothetical protein [Fimbriimonadales bacterium]
MNSEGGQVVGGSDVGLVDVFMWGSWGRRTTGARGGAAARRLPAVRGAWAASQTPTQFPALTDLPLSLRSKGRRAAEQGLASV